MTSNLFSKLKRLAVSAIVMGMAVTQPVSMMPKESPFNTVITAEAASKKTKVVPDKVTLSKVSSSAYNKITISWKKTKNATNYLVYYKKKGASKWTKLTTLSSSKTSYTHTASKSYPITVGQDYSYTVKAYNKDSKKYGSYNTNGLTTKTLPNTVVLKSASANAAKTAVTVSWNKTAGCDQYLIYRKTKTNPNWVKIGTVKSSVTTFTDKNPVKNTINTYTVKGYYTKTKVSGKYDASGKSVSTVVKTEPETEQKPTETEPSKPTETEPATEQKPVETEPETEQKPVETEPETEQKPVETEPETEQKPAETEPATEPSKPVETEPATEQKPAETEPATEQKPVETEHTHTYEWVTVKEATCGAIGQQKHICKSCNNVDETRILLATGNHNWKVTSTVPASCDEEGSTYYKCTGCNQQKGETIPPTGNHNWNLLSEQDATCLFDGYKQYTCSDCARMKTETTQSKLGHNFEFDKVVNKPTMYLEGNTIYRCSRCQTIENRTTPKLTSPVRSEQEVYSILMSFQETYPNETPWGMDASYVSNLHGRLYACDAFANLLSDAAFDDAFEYKHHDINDIHVGDFIYTPNHVSIALGTSDGFVITVDGNLNGKVYWNNKLIRLSEIEYIGTRY